MPVVHTVFNTSGKTVALPELPLHWSSEYRLNPGQEMSSGEAEKESNIIPLKPSADEAAMGQQEKV